MNADDDTEICGLRGDSDVGYCTCTRPAGHTADPDSYHGCHHAPWY